MSRIAQKQLKVSSSEFKTDDRVQVIDREPTPEENKSRIFYNHMRGLTGTVRRVYEEVNEIWVDVDMDSLTEEVRKRHLQSQDQMKKKWLDNLSDEARRKLGEAEKRFSLRYSILVNPDHLILKERGQGSATSGEASAAGGSQATEAQRKTLKDLNNAEQEFLDRARTQKQPE